MEILTRSEAKAIGAKRYFTGKACINGHVAQRGTQSGNCLPCLRIRWEEYRNRTPIKERRSAYNKANYWKDPVASRWRSRRRAWRSYGVNPDMAEALLRAHDGRCECCGSNDPGGKKGWSIDHDHTSGVIRGVLCTKCNTVLGMAEDSPRRLQAAIEYLAKHGVSEN